MRPRLRTDVRFVEFPDGVYLHSDHGACTLAGRQAYAWLSRLAPALTGEYTLDELTAGLSAEKRTVVERLVASLAEQRYVVDARADEPHGLDAAEQETYADEIAFIRYATDSAERRFERLRAARVAVLGQGPLAEALVVAGLRCGLRDITLYTDDDRAGTATASRLAAARRDPRQSVRVARPPEPVGPPRDATLVVQVSADRSELVALCQSGADTGIPLAQVWVRPDEAWLSPVGPIHETGAESAWHRLAGRPATPGDHGEPHPDPTAGEAGDGVDWWTGPVPTVVATQLTMGCFAHLTGLDAIPPRPAAAHMVTRIDLHGLDTSAHRVRRHPLAVTPPPVPPDTPPSLAGWTALPGVPAETVWERVGPAVDPRTGLLGSIDEEGLGQLPLWVCRASLADPLGTSAGRVPRPEAYGWGPDRVTARLRTLLAALAGYACLAVPTGSRPEGWDLTTGEPYRAPGWEPPATPYRLPIGAAAALDGNSAVLAGLRAQCAAIAARQYGEAVAGGTYPAVDPIAFADAGLDRLLRQLSLAEQKIRVRDLTGLLNVPIFAVESDDAPPIVCCDPDPATALRDGLERALLGWQTRTGGAPVRPETAPTWPPTTTAPTIETTSAPTATAPAIPTASALTTTAVTTAASDGVSRLVDALRAAGHVPVAVPLHHDPEAVRILPFLVRVVLRNA
ncbi:hypothetical protein [Plantactinospora sonchi]|uniref:YcaO domain-containing protein n=1 Tax=Plantactinospora sonchi TaxID=1544735 RepID=A0ABU7RMB7_9ACTN